jgi:hypothetical protein
MSKSQRKPGAFFDFFFLRICRRKSERMAGRGAKSSVPGDFSSVGGPTCGTDHTGAPTTQEQEKMRDRDTAGMTSPYHFTTALY